MKTMLCLALVAVLGAGVSTLHADDASTTELRTLASKVATARADFEQAESHAKRLLESKTQMHPEVISARTRVSQDRERLRKAEAALTQAETRLGRKAPAPKAPGPDDRRVEEAQMLAQLRLLADQRAKVELKLRALRQDKTEFHPAVQAQARKLADLDRRIDTEKRKLSIILPAEATTNTDTARELKALRADVAAMRLELSAMRTMLEKLLNK